ncbi:MAG: ATPase, T2SS/T4P/T4SS family [Alphaproteobacteria bacterium]|nr:ATPase, T2SS/T4P/T4SS family [Alphaproteobacteria bacterium]
MVLRVITVHWRGEDGTNKQTSSRQRVFMDIVDLMISDKVITIADLQNLPVSVQKDPETLIEALGKAGKLSNSQQSRYKAIAFDFPIRSDEDMTRVTPHQVDGVDRDFMQFYTTCPIELGRGQILWAAADLPNKRLHSEIVLRHRKNRHEFVWASPRSIEAAIERMSKREGHSLKFLVENAYAQINAGNDDAVISLTDEIIRTAYKNGASDLHIEILNRKPTVMARIDNELEELVSLPVEVYDRVLGRLRHLAGVSAENFKKPLYGRMTFELTNRQSIDIRYTTQPISLEGTAKIAMRFLRPFEGSMDNFGYAQATIDKIDQLMRFEEGVIIFAGPTGQGKSTAARLMIRRGQRPGQNVISYEKQIEERMDNVIQTEEDLAAGLNLESFMYAALGLDPDVLYIGEVRSPEDTRRCIDAGNLGHLVITTMHANDSFMTLDRLLQRGVQPELIFSNIRGIISQRLVRRLCPKCKIPFELDDELATALNKVRDAGFKAGEPIYRQNKNGCSHCHNRGFLGRIAIGEALEMWRREIHRNVWAGNRLRPDWIDVLREQAYEVGMRDMLFYGLGHVKTGITALEELERFFSADLETIR